MQTYLSKAGYLLAPDAFNLALDGEEALLAVKIGQTSVEKLADKVTRYKKGISKISGHLRRLEGGNDKER